MTPSTQIKTLAQECADKLDQLPETKSHKWTYEGKMRAFIPIIELTLTKALEGMITREEYEAIQNDNMQLRKALHDKELS